MRRAFKPDVLRLFAELEAQYASMPRRDPAFSDESRELARRLDLISEWWTGNSVLDRSARTCRPPEYIASRDWHTCRRVREALLEALNKSRTGTRSSTPLAETISR